VPRTCTACSHDEHHQINVDLVHRDPYRRIASRYGLSEAAVRRHAQEHIPELLVEAYESLKRGDAEDLAGELFKIKDDVERLKARAEEEGDLRTALLGCDKALKALELQAKVEQIIATRPTINLHLNPQYIAVRSAIVQAVDPYPEAKEAISQAMLQIEEGNGLG
jgi:hypothetical protein